MGRGELEIAVDVSRINTSGIDMLVGAEPDNNGAPKFVVLNRFQFQGSIYRIREKHMV
jgi:hypothetical protein